MYYEILGKIIEIKCCDVFGVDGFLLDRSVSNQEIFIFNVFPYKHLIKSCYGIRNIPQYSNRAIQQIFLLDSDKDVVMSIERCDWTCFDIYAGKGHKEAIREFVLVGLYSWFSLHQTLLLHASAIDYNGRSLVFTAPSGAGKTTQAELWMQYRRAKILNGDKVFLKQEADAIHAWGSPWTGSSPYGLNSSAPLEAIIILKQAKENSIRRLDTLEAMAEFVPNVFFPRWDERCEQGVLDFLDKVMSETRFYLLSCRPDEEAVEITEKAIFGDGLRKEG